MSKKVSDQLVDTLHKSGIKRIYAVTGDSLNFVNDAVRRHQAVDWIHVRHEESAAFAAGAEAQLNRIGCCAGSCGPGHVHLINGLYDAHRTNCSVLAIASMCQTVELGTQYFQETDTTKLFDDCSGYNHAAYIPEQFPRMLQAALQHTITRKEVSVLGLPGDLAASKAAADISAPYPLQTLEACRPSDGELKKLAGLINDAKNITIFCGVGAKDAHDEVVELAATIKAPVAYTFKSKMDIQYDNPYEIGMTGLLGLPPAYQSMHSSDLLLMLGTDFPYTPFLPEDCMIVQLDIRPERIGRRAKVDHGFAGDVKETLLALLPMLEEKKDRVFLDKQLDHYESMMKLEKQEAEKGGKEDVIAPEFVASVIDRLADDDAIFTVDTGMCCVWGARYLTATRKREMIGSFNHGSMANAMPQAIGAALARPGQQVVALCGDGGISMLLGELATIVQYKLPIKLVVFNNRALGMVKLEMEVAGLPDWNTDMYNPDFAAVALAMGIEGYRVVDPSNVEQTIRKAFQSEGPVLVEVLTDPNSLALPPRIEFTQMKGFAEAMVKIIAKGDYKEVIDTVKSNFKHWRELL